MVLCELKKKSFGWVKKSGLILGLVMVLSGPAGAALYSGTGTTLDPFIIDSAAKMNDIGLNELDWDKNFLLTADIDLGIYIGEDFNIIGANPWADPNVPFTGVFDGNGHTISNFTYTTTASETGLFGFAEDAEFKNIGITNPNIDAGQYAAALVGRIGIWSEIVYTTVITNCYVEGGSVTGSTGYAAGLVGVADDIVTLSNCYATCSVSGDWNVGGLMGGAGRGTITNCYATGQILASSTCGGLIGATFSAGGYDLFISQCYATGNVTCNGTNAAGGGLVGELQGGGVYDSHATGDVYSYGIGSKGDVGKAGGLVGAMTKHATSLVPEISNCYATGNVTAGYAAGGLAGSGGSYPISDSWASGNVEVIRQDVLVFPFARPFAGGLVGVGGDINRCYATGNVSSTYSAGGLVGNGYNISNSYATGSVTGVDVFVDAASRLVSDLGGLVGGGGDITSCYSTGSVSVIGGVQPRNIGGLVGKKGSSSATASFWDTETSGQATSDGGIGKATAQMQDMGTFLGAGWDYVNIWQQCSGRAMYPALAWEDLLMGDFVDPVGVGVEDLVFLASTWLDGGLGMCGGADLTGDGETSFPDFALLAADWMTGFEPVAPQVFLDFTFDSDPGWTTTGEWAFGQPTGNGGSVFGGPDPTAGNSGSNVYGVNLTGDYDDSDLGGPYRLTSLALDCSNFSQVTLKFARWLNTDEAQYVSNSIEVSNNGSTWTTVWENLGGAITDFSWEIKEYDISTIADGQSTVFVRWNYQVIGLAWAYSGWNIDDVQLLGISN